jgi:hypothetical protein
MGPDAAQQWLRDEITYKVDEYTAQAVVWKPSALGALADVSEGQFVEQQEQHWGLMWALLRFESEGTKACW